MAKYKCAMYYPEFLNENDLLGIVALSAGTGKKIDEYKKSLEILNKEGFRILEAPSVRNNNERANSEIIRAKELNDLIINKDVKAILCATGGDSQIETLPYIDYKSIKKNPKWIMGYSDPTNLLLPVTTMLDIATIYDFNALSLDGNKLDQKNFLRIIKGDLFKQKSFSRFQSFIDIINDSNKYKKVAWKANKQLKLKGRLIGGCLDIIEKMVGSKYDAINKFIDKYKDNGIIWYFDIFSLSSYQTYLSLIQLKNAGYFRYCKGVLIGRVAFPNNNDGNLINDYKQAYDLVFKDIPYIYEMDIGHTKPKLTLINGAIANVNYKDNKGDITFYLK